MVLFFQRSVSEIIQCAINDKFAQIFVEGNKTKGYFKKPKDIQLIYLDFTSNIQRIKMQLNLQHFFLLWCPRMEINMNLQRGNLYDKGRKYRWLRYQLEVLWLVLYSTLEIQCLKKIILNWLTSNTLIISTFTNQQDRPKQIVLIHATIKTPRNSLCFNKYFLSLPFHLKVVGCMID